MSSIKTLSIISICIVLVILGWNNLFISEENREVTQFNSIYSSGPINVYIESGEEESVRVRADNNIHDKIVVEVIEGELKINENSHIHRERVLDVYVNYVSLDSIHASGASTITSRGVVQNSKLNIKASGASEIKLQVTTDSMTLKMNQNANVQLAGEATYFNFQINHVGDLMAYNLVSQHCKAILDTGPQSPGVARINVEKTLDVFIQGPRALKYKGNPDIINQVIKGGGTLKKH